MMLRRIFGFAFFALLLGSQSFGQQPPPNITVTSVNSTYKTAPGNRTGTFTTGQAGSVLLNRADFNDSGGALHFSYPGGVASDGTRLLLADRGNNRVLIWNSIPTANTPPDLVLGQKDFIAYDSGNGRDQMNWPVSVRTDGRRVIVADTNNDRILIWNSFPTRNGQAADLVLQSQELRWPWGLWTDGTRLVVSCTGSSRLMFWNQFPAQDNAAFSFQLTGNGQLGTPRTITSDGKSLIVGDHNPVVPNVPAGTTGNFVWKTFPTANEQPVDFFMSDPQDGNYGWMQGEFAADGKLFMIGRRLHLWNSMITDSADRPDASSSLNFEAGDGTDLMIVNGKLFLSLYNGNRVLVYNSLPTNINQQPDFAIGSPDINTNSLATNYRLNNPVPVTDGKSLWATSDFDRKMYVWKNIPDQSGAKPDFVYNLPAQIWDNDIYNNRLVLAGQNAVYIWNNLPRNGELPDVTFNGSIGNLRFQSLRGVAMDSKYFYLGDEQAGKIYVFEGIPTQTSVPRFTLDLPATQRLTSDGTTLVAMSQQVADGGAFYFYKVSDLTASPTQLRWAGKFNQPYNVLLANGGFYVADMGSGRVQIWNRLADAQAGRSPDVLLGAKTLNDFTHETAKDKLFRPAALTFDGSYLWVGEFKFSHRLIRFDLGGSATTNSVSAVSAASFSGTELASESIAAAFGSGLANSTESASGVPLPTTLGGVSVKVKDSLGVERNAPLFFVSPTQINFQVPPGTAAGAAAISAGSGAGTLQIANVAPGMFSANANGSGLAAALVLRIKADGSQSYEPIGRFDSALGRYVAAPIDLGAATDQVFLLFFGTGWRLRSSLSGVTVTIGGTAAEVLFAGAQGDFVGLDQVNLRLPQSLKGRGDVAISLSIDGKAANQVSINIK
ncbi:MAG: hypothetical protein ACKVZH_12185 [Blastocatellia bacterium]